MQTLLPARPPQPPSGGCVLKPFYSPTLRYGKHPAAFGRLCVETLPYRTSTAQTLPQPPSGGCVLKLNTMKIFEAPEIQPPSGGCVLKRHRDLRHEQSRYPAAFGRLCVETSKGFHAALPCAPAAFGRLCVETNIQPKPVTGRRSSRLRAAVC